MILKGFFLSFVPESSFNFSVLPYWWMTMVTAFLSCTSFTFLIMAVWKPTNLRYKLYKNIIWFRYLVIDNQYLCGICLVLQVECSWKACYWRYCVCWQWLHLKYVSASGHTMADSSLHVWPHHGLMLTAYNMSSTLIDTCEYNYPSGTFQKYYFVWNIC